MIKLSVVDETSPLEAVILGTAQGVGDVPKLEDAYDPKSKEHIAAGTYPKEKDMVQEMDAFAKVLEKHGVKVYRPEIIPDYNQIFSRDIGFVIDDKFIKPRILKDRDEEIQGIQYVIDQMDPAQVLQMPEGAHAEGGDVMPWKDHLFVGYSGARWTTNTRRYKPTFDKIMAFFQCPQPFDERSKISNPWLCGS